MKPLVSTARMKEGSLNENQVLRAIHDFYKKNEALNLSVNLSTLPEEPFALKVEYVRGVGLVCSNNSDMIADSPDGMMGYTDGTAAHIASLQIKNDFAEHNWHCQKHKKQIWSISYSKGCREECKCRYILSRTCPDDRCSTTTLNRTTRNEGGYG